ncbi:EpsG family protein [Citrobacter freundii]|uniref:EpsG family protein n=2 Tax=Citrobacter freundii TaxID=546 RepID=UPI0009B9D7AE|nr:EpsG family protein [Citrobacter freundii]EIN8655919.1 EpsG family protein [Citrobacter freundii]EJD6419591.1 EpsG family protein [Citrobacter freundii]EJD6623185.1 EpsG family protein [Citrobacter freundii]HBZ9065987.1 EpsG family protein [Citrobacter freundii]HBZ9267133.1 EpsG family protein [Citrobacter freundii]
MSVKTRNLLCFMMVVSAAFFAVTIMPYSNDHQAYIDLFKYTIQDTSYERMEIGFKSIVSFFKFFGFNFELFWFLIAFISLLLKLYLLKSYDSNIFILFLLYLLYCISLLALHETTQIRAAVAIAFGMLGFRCRNKILGISLFFISVLFHYSAIIFIILYALNKIVKPYKFTWLIVVIAIATIMPIILKQLSGLLISINPLFSLYLENSDNAKVNQFSFTSVLAIVFFVVNFFVGRRINYYNDGKNFIFKQYNMFSFLYLSSVILLTALSFSPVISIRLYELLSLSPFVIIACLYSKCIKCIFDLDFRLQWLRRSLFLVLWLISMHRFVAYYFVNPIITF